MTPERKRDSGSHRNRNPFSLVAQGFSHHVRQEHNMWAYIFFFIHLDDTKPNDYTALDLYVSSLVSRLPDCVQRMQK